MLDPATAIDGLRQFFKLHATCGGTCYDTPDLPGPGYRVIAACRCGDTVEYWLADGALSPRQLLDATMAAAAARQSALAPAFRAA
jgi:hypothetical protein